jgi:hypothetical protein
MQLFSLSGIMYHGVSQSDNKISSNVLRCCKYLMLGLKEQQGDSMIIYFSDTFYTQW